MKHKEFREKVYNYLNDELEGNDLDDFEVHFFDCLSCRDFLLSQKLAFSTLREYISSADFSELKSLLDLESIVKDAKKNYKKDLSSRLTKKNVIKMSLLPQRNKPFKITSSLDSNLALAFESGDNRKSNSKKYLFKIGEPLLVQVELLKAGYLTIVHYDEKKNFEIVFPRSKTDENLIEFGRKKIIQIMAKEPIGRHFLKAILTLKKMSKFPSGTDKEKEQSIAKRKYFEQQKFKHEGWFEEKREFYVV